jgi:hypothetical protein
MIFPIFCLFLFSHYAQVGANAVVYKMASSSCDAFTDEKSCLSGTSNGETCSWCESAAVGATCFTSSDAKTLPPSVFQCEFPSISILKATSCDSQTTEKNCMSSSSDKGKCSWCNSAAVGGTCFEEEDAKSLPSSVFQCEYQKALSVLKESACDSQKSEKDCMSSTSGSENCSWCMSAAVGGTCFIESDAKSLPASVFQCEYQAGKLRESSCDSAKNEKSCLTSTTDGNKCAWCESAAVGGACYLEEDAHSLPSSIFSCDYQTPASFL